MSFTKLAAVFLVLQASVSGAVFQVRDINGNWRSMSWEKRSGPGDVLRIPLTNNNDKSYSAAVQMGTPFQSIQMAVALSQNYIVVESSDSGAQSGLYNRTASTSFTPSNVSTTFSGLTGPPIKATFFGESCKILDFPYNASIALTSPSVQANVYPEDCHGVLGYGVDPAPEVPANGTLLGVFLPPNITSAQCGIELGRTADGGDGGIFTMGGNDSSAFTGNATTMLVPSSSDTQRPSWSIPIDAVYAGGSSSIQNVLYGGIASIDPYYPTISLPASVVVNMYSQIEQATVSLSNSARYIVPCNSTIQIVLTFGGKNFSLDTRDAITKENDTCYGTIEISDSSLNVYRVGNPFMRNVYTFFGATFNGGVPTFTVGFADKVNRNASSATTTTASRPTTTAPLSATTASGSSSTKTATASPTGAATINAPPILFALVVAGVSIYQRYMLHIFTFLT